MKLTVERDVLADAVTWVARSLPNRPPTAVLAGLKLSADAQGVLTLSAFDYEVSARVEIPANVEIPGDVLVVGKLLADISKSLPSKPVNLSLEGAKVDVVCGSSRFSLMTLPTDEYPQPPTMPDSIGTIDATDLSAAIAQVTTAASRDDTLPILTGVRMEIEGDSLTLMSTDRYRLALRDLSWKPTEASVSKVALVRAKTLAEVARSLTDGPVTVALNSGGSHDLVGFEAGGKQMTSLLLDGEYPKVRALFPDESPVYAVVERTSLLEAVRRVSLVAERNTPVRLAFTEGQVTLEAGHGDQAQASEAMQCTLVGDDITVAFNPAYLLDGLGALTTDYARLAFTAASKPAVLTGQAENTGEDDERFRYLLMPVRVAS